jgi:hypothetical protein
MPTLLQVFGFPCFCQPQWPQRLAMRAISLPDYFINKVLDPGAMNPPGQLLFIVQ